MNKKEMKCRCSNAIFSADFALLSQINLAAGRLEDKLSRLDLKELGISEYNQRYLGSYLNDRIDTFQPHRYLLSLCLALNEIPLNKLVFVDYGGGCGIFSLLAKELGIGRVLYNDIYDISCEDTKILARATGINIDDYICGDIDRVIDYLKKQSFSINAISSLDVIEHIYDIESYLRKLRFLSTGSFRIVFGSGANIKNPIIGRRWKKRHLEFEYRDRECKWGHKERDTLRSYLNVRKEIIKECDPRLSSELVEEIAKRTRGLMKHEIERCFNEYKASGEILYDPGRPTNTCDPFTGSWEERLMKTEWLEAILSEEGYEVKILSGYWSHSSILYKRVIKNLLNIGIKYLGRNALFLAPYYVIYADYKP